jgi:hypothetical protein
MGADGLQLGGEFVIAQHDARRDIGLWRAHLLEGNRSRVPAGSIITSLTRRFLAHLHHAFPRESGVVKLPDTMRCLIGDALRIGGGLQRSERQAMNRHVIDMPVAAISGERYNHIGFEFADVAHDLRHCLIGIGLRQPTVNIVQKTHILDTDRRHRVTQLALAHGSKRLFRP